MTEKELEGAKKLIENKDVKKGSYSFIGDSNITYADIKILLDYIKQLEQEYQKQKEVIDEAVEILGKYTHFTTPSEEQNSYNEDLVDKVYNMLKEVEHE